MTVATRTARRAGLGQSVAIAASGGLALALGAPAAVAAPGLATVPAEPVLSAAPAVSPTVVVPTEAEWSLATTEVTGEEPAPEPEPVVRSTSTASRSAAREPISTTSAAAPNSATAAAVLEIARRYVGVPYVYGGATPAGFDCSGFTQYVFAQVGVYLPRSSSEQRYAGTVVPASQAQPGDLVWWPGHIGIYTGNGQHIAARQPGTALYEGPVYGANPVYIRVL